MDPADIPPFEFVQEFIFDPRIVLPTSVGIVLVLILGAVSFARPRWGMLLILVTAPLQRVVLISDLIGDRFTCQEAVFLGTFAGALIGRQIRMSPVWTGPMALPVFGLLLTGVLSLIGSDYMTTGFGEIVILGYLFICYRLIVDHVGTNPGTLSRMLGAWKLTFAAIALVSAPASVLNLVFGIETHMTDGIRLIATFFNANQTGSFFVAGTCLFLADVLDGRTRMRHRLRGLVITASAAVSTYFTASRASLLALAVGALVVLLLKKVKITTVVVAALLFALGSAGFGYFRDNYADKAKIYDTRFEGSTNLQAPDAQARLRNWETGLKAFANNPVVGVGIGTIYLYGDGVSVLEEGTEGMMVHNTYLSFLAETGIVGFVFLLLLIWRSLREVRSALALARGTSWENTAIGLAAGLAGLCVFNVFHYGIRARHLWITLALTAALVRVCREQARVRAAAHAAAPQPARGAA